MKKIFLISILIYSISISQISIESIPKSMNHILGENITKHIMEPINIDQLHQEDEASDKEIPFRFGYDIPVNIGLSDEDGWEVLDNGDKIWRVNIISNGAYSINIIYDIYDLPPGAELFIYSPNNEMILGAYTSDNNKEYGGMATSPIEGDEIIIEYNEPADAIYTGELHISHIIHGYKDVFFNKSRDYGDSGSCNNNVNCPEGDLWNNEIRAAAMILTSNGSRLCSGSMVNNVRQDLTPYFLTANHCIYGNTNSWIIMFNYESSGCSNQNGPTNMTVQGTTLKSNGSTSDFALFELSEIPPESYNIHYSGWSALDAPPTQPVAIHHPSGDIKKISFDYDTGISDGWSGNDGSHWRVADWEDGTTEPGSSGSPLYDSNHHLVGQLHGGEASCSYNVNDYYGKFSTSWNSGLSTYLDPDNTGTFILDGTDAIDIPDPQLSYETGILFFELSEGELGNSTINITNTGEEESILNYNLIISPFDNSGGGPDSDGNFWTDSDLEPNLNSEWIDITDTGTLYNFPDNDESGIPIDIGFDFNFYDNNYNSIIINPNGWIGFGEDNESWENVSIPSAGAPGPAIFGFWDDLNPVNDNCNEYCSGNVLYHTDGERLIVWFNSVAHWWSNFENSIYDFQIIINATGNIKLNYNTLSGNYSSATVGIQNANGSSGLEIVYDNDYLHDGITFALVKNPEWLSVMNPSNNELLEGITNVHTVQADANNILYGTYNAYIKIQSNADNSVSLPVTMSVGESSSMMGDVNQDDIVNILDVVLTVNFIVGNDIPNDTELLLADINNDGLLNVLDIVQLINIILDS